jgi:hypothetical protein
MLPKNSKHFIKPTADELDCDVDLVGDVVSFFYKDVRKNLVEMSNPNIQVENLGSFRVKKNELPKLVAKYKKHLDVLKPETFNQVTLFKSIQTKLEKVLGIQKQIDDEKQRKTKFIQAKNERKANQNMEQPESNS